MPSLTEGSALWRSYSLAGFGALNLQIKTVSSLAEEKMAPRLYREGQEVASRVLTERLAYEVMHNLSNGSFLTYFNSLEITPGIAGAVHAACCELKEEGYLPGDIPPHKMVDQRKGDDLNQIYAAYQDKLKEKSLVDRVDLLKMAVDSYTESFVSGAMLLVPSNLRVTPLERKLLSRMLNDNPWASLSLEEVKGLKRPGNYFFGHSPPEDVENQTSSPLGHLYYGAANSSFPHEAMPGVTFFHAYGESSEVREAIRRIRAEDLPLEEVVVYYTSREPYARLFYEEARRCGFPITLGEGLSAGCFRPGEFFFALTEWIKSGFQATLLHRLISGKAFITHEDEPSPRAMAQLLRSSPIGWGRERYQKWIAQVEEEDRKSPEQEPTNSSEDNAGYSRFRSIRSALKDLLQEILEALPAPDGDGLIDPGELACGMADLITERSRVSGEEDARAYQTIRENLYLLSRSPLEKTGLEEGVTWLEGVINSLEVGSSLPQPGSLHLDGFRSGIWNYRKRVFVVGLEARKFPGQVIEDPILLDLEREELRGELIKHRFQPMEKLYEMVQLLAAQSDHESQLTLSFPSFDTAEYREKSPSPLLLQVYRLVSGDRTADYSSFAEKLGSGAGFVPASREQALGEGEWWLEYLVRGRAGISLREQVLECYPHLKRGCYARQQRESTSFTPFDGNISPAESLWKNGCFLSASALEELARCPYGYFLKHILGIAPPEELTYQPHQWLDPASRGTLMHRIFEEFYRKLLERNEKPSYERHGGLLESIAHTRLEQQIEEIPPPHRVVYEQECKEILESCRLFLRTEEENSYYSTPIYLELTFGIGEGTKPDIPGTVPPVQVILPSGRYFYLRGKIDRVDWLRQPGSQGYVVIDYKTGGTYLYRPGVRFRGGRQLQHVLYGLALEEILSSKGRGSPSEILQCGYQFPTLKGEGQRVLRSYPECREHLFDILDNLSELISQGAFTMTVNPEEDCAFCDYPPVCAPEKYGAAAVETVQEDREGPLSIFRSVREMD